MRDPGYQQMKLQRRQRRWRRWLVNLLLLPPALLYVIVENVFWVSAKTLLRQAERIDAVTGIQRKLRKLPPAAVLPLFLIPEAFSHIGGFWATDLIVHRKWAAAMLAGLLVKGLATLMEVWIYQSCEPTLMSVRWFAWLHGKFQQGRRWVADRMMPVRALARYMVSSGRSGLAARFRRLRALVAHRLGLARK
jgi:hypothetical protein